MTMLGWKLVHGGKTPPTGEVVRPDERLSSVRMVGLGAQHIVAMFGATFVFPAIMGLNPNLAVLMSGVATILFLLIVKGRVPSYLGTSASFVAAVAAIRAQGGDSADVTGSILDRRRDPRADRRAGALRRSALRPRRAAAGRDRRRRHADRVQPGDRRDADLLPVRAVDRVADRAVRDRRRGARARLHQPDRGLPRARLRLPHLLARRPVHVGARRATRRASAWTSTACSSPRSRVRTGSACRRTSSARRSDRSPARTCPRSA